MGDQVGAVQEETFPGDGFRGEPAHAEPVTLLLDGAPQWRVVGGVGPTPSVGDGDVGRECPYRVLGFGQVQEPVEGLAQDPSGAAGQGIEPVGESREPVGFVVGGVGEDLWEQGEVRA